MSYQRPKWQSYTLPSWERPSILREPPKSIHTRKKERIEMGDVTYMLRNDDSRITEGINYIARGSNPMVDISYSNYGGNGAKLTSMPTIAATNPYKAIKDGAFRPPIFTQEDLLPLSRMRRPEIAVSTNPGISTSAGFVTPNLQNAVDLSDVSNAIDVEKINYLAMKPSASFKVSLPLQVDVFGDRAFQTNKLRFAQYSNPSTSYETENPMIQKNDGQFVVSAIDDKNVNIENIIANPNLKIYVQDGKTGDLLEVQGSIKDKINIAVQSKMNKPIQVAKSNGTKIKIKKYVAKVVSSNPSSSGGDAIVLKLDSAEDKIKLDRNMPLYAAQAVGKSQYQKQYDNTDTDAIVLDRNLPVHNATSGLKSDFQKVWENTNSNTIELDKNLPMHQATSGLKSSYQKQYENTNPNAIELYRNLPTHIASSGVTPIYQIHHSNSGERELESKLHTYAISNVSDRSMSVSSHHGENYEYETQARGRAKGLGAVGSFLDNASGIGRMIYNDVQLPNLSGVQKITKMRYGN